MKSSSTMLILVLRLILQSGNILIDARGGIKLGDFGVSACLFDSGDRQRVRNTFVGTPCWYVRIFSYIRTHIYKISFIAKILESLSAGWHLRSWSSYMVMTSSQSANLSKFIPSSIHSSHFCFFNFLTVNIWLNTFPSRADIWSFGITALELAHGHAPFSRFPPMKVHINTLSNTLYTTYLASCFTTKDFKIKPK